MKNLRKFRTALRLTQQQVARALGTTQQTVGRWESGAAEPSLTALRDLAMLFDASVDTLIGTGPYAHRLETVLPAAPRSSHPGRGTERGAGQGAGGAGRDAARNAGKGAARGATGTGEPDRLRGHVGILLRGQEQSIWYPITDAEWRRTDNHLANADPGEPWACVRTGNNRLVLANLGAVERICLLDAAAPRPEHDWDPDRLGEEARPFEFYKGLLNYFFDPEELAATASPAAVAALRAFVRTRRFHVEDAERLLLQTHLHRTSGEVVSLLADTACLVELVTRADQGLGRTVRLAEADGRICFYPSDTIGLVDMPLTLVHERYLSEQDAA